MAPRYDLELARKFGKKGNKFGAKKARLFGSLRLYDSGAERDRAADLRLMEKGGLIVLLEEQPFVQLTLYHSYHPDFVYWEKTREGRRLIFEDVKGASTERFIINCRLWHERGPAVLRITRRAGRDKNWSHVKEIMPDKIDAKMWKSRQ
jgi:hypothetical protein